MTKYSYLMYMICYKVVVAQGDPAISLAMQSKPLENEDDLQTGSKVDVAIPSVSSGEGKKRVGFCLML